MSITLEKAGLPVERGSHIILGAGITLDQDAEGRPELGAVIGEHVTYDAQAAAGSRVTASGPAELVALHITGATDAAGDLFVDLTEFGRAAADLQVVSATCQTIDCRIDSHVVTGDIIEFRIHSVSTGAAIVSTGGILLHAVLAFG